MDARAIASTATEARLPHATFGEAGFTIPGEMTMTKFELDLPFLQSASMELDAGDFEFGYKRGFIKPSAIVAYATEEVGAGPTDTALVDLSLLLNDEVDEKVPGILDSARSSGETPVSARKWLYLQL